MSFAESAIQKLGDMEEILNDWALGVKNLPKDYIAEVNLHILCEKIKTSFQEERWELMANLKEELDMKLKLVSGATGLRSSSYLQLLIFAKFRQIVS